MDVFLVKNGFKGEADQCINNFRNHIQHWAQTGKAGAKMKVQKELVQHSSAGFGRSRRWMHCSKLRICEAVGLE